jgi:ribonuclease J
MKILALGGLGEIGMNCMILETDREILMIDCGVLFSDLNHLGVEFVIPDFTYLIERKEKIKGIWITHGHEDHIGALSFAFRSGIQAPIYASPFTAALIYEKLKETELHDRVDLRTFEWGQTVNYQDFKVSIIPVNHSIVESSALVIDTPVGKIIHTGDFKIDPSPYYGKPTSMDAFKKLGDEGVLLLMSDSTNVEVCQHGGSESRVYDTLEKLLATVEGMTVISMFASNIGRMGQIFELAGKLGKKICIAGRSIDQNTRVAFKAGYIENAEKVLIPFEKVDQMKRSDVILIATGSQGEPRAALHRMGVGEHQLELEQGDRVILSSKFIPGNEKAIGRVINNLFRQGAEVIYDAVEEIHVSGHATRPELKLMIEAVRPKFFIPIHGEYRHLCHHAKLAKECGIKSDHVLIVSNGDLIELTKDSLTKVGQLEEHRVLVEGREGGDISKIVLKERRALGEKGIVFSLIVRNRNSGRIVAGPQIFAKGLVHEDTESWLIEESIKVVRKLIQDYEWALDRDESFGDLQEMIRVSLRRFVDQNIGKKPTVLSVILEL